MSNRNWIWFIVVSLLFPASALSQQRSKPSNNRKCDPFIYERLRNYLDRNEFQPIQVFKNPDIPPPESGARKFELGVHTLEWINEADGRRYGASIKINGDPVPLDGLRTINIPDGENRFGFEMVDHWEEIKLYKTGSQELIAVSMSPAICSGLSCSVGVQLWYDVKSKQPTLFGTFRTESELRLFNWPGGGDLYILGSTYTGDLHGSIGPIVRRYEFYKILPDGRSEIQKDKTGKPYFLKHTSYPELKRVNGNWVRKPGLPIDTLEQNWLEDVLKF